MTSLRVRPYQSLSQEAFPVPVWTLIEHGSVPSNNPKELPGWDYQTRFTVETQLEADRTTILDRCALVDTASVAAMIRWTSTGVPLASGFSETHQLTDDPVKLSVSPSSELLGGRLRLQVCIVLDTSLPDSESRAGPLGPNRCGAVLWESAHHTVKLEGEADRFPIITLDFDKEQWLHENALWALRWTPDDYTAAAGHAVQLLINTEHPTYSTIREPTEQKRKNPLVSTLYWDVARQMLEHGIDDEDYHTLDGWPEGSIGAVIANLVELWFPRQDLDGLRQMRSKRPQEFHSTVQGVNRLAHRFGT